MPAVRPLHTRLALVSLAVLAACAPPVKPPPTPPPPVVETVMPLPPMGAAADMDVPDVGDDGQRITPNRKLTAYQSLWHLRMALNVAALSCHGDGDAVRLRYNQMLHIHKGALADANMVVDTEYKARFGSAAVAARENLNTTVYNFFALPPAQKAFCAAALTVGARMNALPPDALLGYAVEGLAALEKPFTDFYEAYADYLRRLEEWRRRFGRTSVTVSVSPTTEPLPPTPPAMAPTQPLLQVQPLPLEAPTPPSQMQ